MNDLDFRITESFLFERPISLSRGHIHSMCLKKNTLAVVTARGGACEMRLWDLRKDVIPHTTPYFSNGKTSPIEMNGSTCFFTYQRYNQIKFVAINRSMKAQADIPYESASFSLNRDKAIAYCTTDQFSQVIFWDLATMRMESSSLPRPSKLRHFCAYKPIKDSNLGITLEVNFLYQPNLLALWDRRDPGKPVKEGALGCKDICEMQLVNTPKGLRLATAAFNENGVEFRDFASIWSNEEVETRITGLECKALPPYSGLSLLPASGGRLNIARKYQDYTGAPGLSDIATKVATDSFDLRQYGGEMSKFTVDFPVTTRIPEAGFACDGNRLAVARETPIGRDILLYKLEREK